MFRRFAPSVPLLFLRMSAATLCGQAANHGSANEQGLGQYYNSAVELQRTGKLNEATEQYRVFLADALGELAVGYSLVPDYTQAAPLFDEALTLDPNSPSLILITRERR